jgi:hypothetical protein
VPRLGRYLKAVETDVKSPTTFKPRLWTATTITAAMRNAIRPYSMAVAADSFLTKRVSVFTMGLHTTGFFYAVTWLMASEFDW